MGRLIIVSNRLPFSFDKTGDDIIVRQSSGGLVSAIKSYLDHQSAFSQFTEQIWVGTLEASEEDWKKANDQGIINSDYGIEPSTYFPVSCGVHTAPAATLRGRDWRAYP